MLGELSSLARDLLLRKTAPQGGTSLLAGGYDEATMRQLGGQFSAARLLQALTLLQSTAAELPRSSNRRTDAELCLIRLCDESLDGSAAGLSARVARLEELLAGGVPVPAASPPSTPTVPSVPAGPAPSPAEDPPPWDDRPPLPEEPPEEPERVFDVPVEAPAPTPGARRARLWRRESVFLARLCGWVEGKGVTLRPALSPQSVQGDRRVEKWAVDPVDRQ